MIKVKYSCHACGIKHQEIQVSPRLPEQDVVKWVRDISGLAISFDHGFRSPNCKSKVYDVCIPTPKGNDGIGESQEKDLPEFPN